MAVIINRYIFVSYIKAFIIVLFLFTFFLEVIDLFSSLWGFLNRGTPMKAIGLIALYGLPKCAGQAAPFAALFAAAYTIGSFTATNELIAFFSVGISLPKVLRPALIFSALFSAALFVFNESVLLESQRKREALMSEFGEGAGQEGVLALFVGNDLLYSMSYSERDKRLSDLVYIELDENNALQRRIDAARGVWKDGTGWTLSNVRIFYGEERPMEQQREYVLGLTPHYSSFEELKANVQTLTLAESRASIERLRQAGLPYKTAQLDYYKRFSEPLVCLIVTIFPLMLQFSRKSALLNSLLQSIVLATFYYILQMISALFAQTDRIAPLYAAFMPLVLLPAGLYAFSQRRRIKRFLKAQTQRGGRKPPPAAAGPA